MSTSPILLPVDVTGPNPALVTAGIQFWWGTFISAVSSIETIFTSGLMNSNKQFNVVVFPEAVPPAISTETPFSRKNHIRASMEAEKVPNVIISGGVRGSSLNFLIVNVDPCMVTSLPNESCTREPSGREPSSRGSAMETCR